MGIYANNFENKSGQNYDSDDDLEVKQSPNAIPAEDKVSKTIDDGHIVTGIWTKEYADSLVLLCRDLNIPIKNLGLGVFLLALCAKFWTNQKYDLGLLGRSQK